MRNAAIANNYVPEMAHVAKILLGELQDTHRKLVEQMANMDALTREPDFDPIRLANGRWRISQASLARRTLAGRICDYLLPRLGPCQAAAIKSLQEADRNELRLSATHVGTWTSETLKKDWAGYCRASRDIRRHMRAHVALEQKLLYPILEQAMRLGQ